MQGTAGTYITGGQRCGKCLCCPCDCQCEDLTIFMKRSPKDIIASFDSRMFHMRYTHTIDDMFASPFYIEPLGRLVFNQLVFRKKMTSAGIAYKNVSLVRKIKYSLIGNRKGLMMKRIYVNNDSDYSSCYIDELDILRYVWRNRPGCFRKGTEEIVLYKKNVGVNKHNTKYYKDSNMIWSRVKPSHEVHGRCEYRMRVLLFAYRNYYESRLRYGVIVPGLTITPSNVGLLIKNIHRIRGWYEVLPLAPGEHIIMIFGDTRKPVEYMNCAIRLETWLEYYSLALHKCTTYDEVLSVIRSQKRIRKIKGFFKRIFIRK